MFSKVLVPVDIDEFDLSIGILPYVSRLSKDLEIPVVILSVLNPDNIKIPEELEDRGAEAGMNVPPGSKGLITGALITGPVSVPSAEESSTVPHETGGPYASQIIENARTEIRRQLNKFVSRLAEEGIDAQCDVVVGPEPAEEIIKFAEDGEFDLIAIATHDRNLIEQAMMGSVTNEVARSSNVPVMAITPEKSEEIPEQQISISRIIVPLDGSPFSEAVLPYAQYLASKMSLEVILARSVAHRDIYPTGAGGAVHAADTGVTATQLYQIAEEDAVEYLNNIAANLEADGLRVSRELLRGATSNNVADLAKQTSNSMIALASRGRSGLMRWVMGSVAEELIRGTGEPVLVIPSGAVEDE